MDAYCYLQATGIVLGLILVLMAWMKLWMFLGDLAEDKLDWNGPLVCVIGFSMPLIVLMVARVSNTLCS